MFLFSTDIGLSAITFIQPDTRVSKKQTNKKRPYYWGGDDKMKRLLAYHRF